MVGDLDDDDRKKIFASPRVDFTLLIDIVTLPDNDDRVGSIRDLLDSKFAGLDYTDVDIFFLTPVDFGSNHHLGRFAAGAAAQG